MEQVSFKAQYTKTASAQFILPDDLNTLKVLTSQLPLRGNEAFFWFSYMFEGWGRSLEFCIPKLWNSFSNHDISMHPIILLALEWDVNYLSFSYIISQTLKDQLQYKVGQLYLREEMRVLPLHKKFSIAEGNSMLLYPYLV